MSSAAYSQPVSQASAASYAAVGQQQTAAAQYGPYGSRVQVCICVYYLCWSASINDVLFRPLAVSG